MDVKENQEYMKRLEDATIKVARAFSNSPEGGAFFLKYTLLPDTAEHNKAVEEICGEIIGHFKEQKKLAEDVVSSLKCIREICLKNGTGASEYVNQQIEGIVHYKAFVDYVKDSREGPIVGGGQSR